MHHELPVQLLEFDKRFEQYGSEFTFYDYNEPLELPSSIKHSFRIIIADPPYLVCFALISELQFEHISFDSQFFIASGE